MDIVLILENGRPAALADHQFDLGGQPHIVASMGNGTVEIVIIFKCLKYLFGRTCLVLFHIFLHEFNVGIAAPGGGQLGRQGLDGSPDLVEFQDLRQSDLRYNSPLIREHINVSLKGQAVQRVLHRCSADMKLLTEVTLRQGHPWGVFPGKDLFQDHVVGLLDLTYGFLLCIVGIGYGHADHLLICYRLVKCQEKYQMNSTHLNTF